MLTSSVLIVGVLPGEVEAMLAAGLGPGLPAGARCPDCDGPLRGRWRGYRRSLRLGGAVWALRIARARCGGCWRTHALVPSFVVPGRLDAAPSLLVALRAGARGVGQRRIAARLGLPETTVRGWCRRLRGQAVALAGRMLGLAGRLDGASLRAPPAQAGLGGVVGGLATLRRAAGRRLGRAGLLDPAGLLVAVSGPALLSHTISPLPQAVVGGEGCARP